MILDVGDAVADFSRDHHEQALTWTAQRCGMVTTTEHALAGLRAQKEIAHAMKQALLRLKNVCRFTVKRLLMLNKQLLLTF